MTEPPSQQSRAEAQQTAPRQEAIETEESGQRRRRSPLFRAIQALAWLAVAACLALLARRLDWARVRSEFFGADRTLGLLALLVWPLASPLQATRPPLLARQALPPRPRHRLPAYAGGA